MLTITMLDEVHTKANKEARKVIKHALAYKKSHWRQGQWSMEEDIRRQFLITGRKNTGGTFLTGLLPRVIKYCNRRGIYLEVHKFAREKIKPDSKWPPNLDGIDFREDQMEAIKRARLIQRGRIIAPTGSGKTLVALGIVSMFKMRRSIFVMHTKDLWSQAKEEAFKFQLNLPPIYAPSGSQQIKECLHSIKEHCDCLMICLIQSLSKINPKDYIDLFDMTLIDECHHVADLKSMYGKFMQHNLSPRRYGFTATVPTKKYQLLVNEGLIGPTIARLKMEEGIKKGIIAKPIVKVVNVEYDAKINQKCQNNYTNFYEHGIIRNKIRNEQIRKIVAKAYKRKYPVLVIIEKLEHGKAIQSLIQRRSGIDIPFISGSAKSKQRDNYRKKIIAGKLNGIIASRIWMEGINIPNLRYIIYAAGMKEKKKTLQAMGRGLRTTDKKKKIILIDFLDPYRYLAQHAIERLQVYNEQKWLNRGK